MPGVQRAMRAVLWESSVILLDSLTCYIYNFETAAWRVRKQFRTNVEYYAAAITKSTIYIAGGSHHNAGQEENDVERESSDDDSLRCTDQVRCMSVLDIIKDKSVVWRHHAKLTKPGIVNVYVYVSLPKTTKRF